MLRTPALLAAAVVASTLCTAASASPTSDRTDRYAEGAETPRSLTEAEQAIIRANPITAATSRAAPASQVRCPAEYEPAEGIMIAYEGSSGWKLILAQMARDITTIGNAKVFCMVDTTSERTTASNQFASLGADMSKVEFSVVRTDSIWMRDYGPRYIFQNTNPDGTGGVRAIVDHTYNRPRPFDNQIPGYWANQRGEPSYLIPLVHGGGNFHLDSGATEGVGHATQLIANENPGLSSSQIIQHWRDYQNLDTVLYTPYPSFVDSTQHIDMWMIMLDSNTVMISEWVNEPTSSWAQTSDNAANYFAFRGFTVYRVPAVRSGGTHYTFTNAVICNDLVLVPSYTAGAASVHNATALATWQAAYPGKTIRQINCQAIVTAAGVMHCIVKHVPQAPGGENPTAVMTTQNLGASLDPSDLEQIQWLTDDDEGAVTADIYLSTDGGQTFPTVVATGLNAAEGSYYWPVPDVGTDQARLRIVVTDGDGNTGSDDSDMDFAITGTAPCEADLAEPFGTLNFFDLGAFLEAFGQQDPAVDFAAPFGVFNFFDLGAYLELFAQGCP